MPLCIMLCDERLTTSVATAIGSQQSKVATVEAEDELPEINESTIDSFSQEVRGFCATSAVIGDGILIKAGP